MGILECDDGNNISGDGCSADCVVEENYICKGGSYNTPDICFETVPPLMASFFQLSQKEMEIQFTELVRFKGKFSLYIYIYIVNDPMKALQLFITGPAFEYIFHVESAILTEETNLLLSLKLNIQFLCTLYGFEVIYITIYI